MCKRHNSVEKIHALQRMMVRASVRICSSAQEFTCVHNYTMCKRHNGVEKIHALQRMMVLH